MNASWQDVAHAFALKFLDSIGQGSKFFAPSLRAWSHDNGCPLPSSQRLWGGVIGRLRREGRVEFVSASRRKYDDDKYASPNSAPTFNSLWRVL